MGYYADYTGTTEELAETIVQGWLYTGQHRRIAASAVAPIPAGVPMCRSSWSASQNHDQVGNRATGDRCTRGRRRGVAGGERAAPDLPMTPLAVHGPGMGGASTPFLLLHRFRRRSSGTARDRRAPPRVRGLSRVRGAGPHETRFPDPQAVSTFEASRLRLGERSEQAAHAGCSHCIARC